MPNTNSWFAFTCIICIAK